MKDTPAIGTPAPAPAVSPPSPRPPAAPPPVPPAAPAAPPAAPGDAHASAAAGGRFPGAVAGGLPEAQPSATTGSPQGVTSIDPTQPTRFAGNPGAAEALMMYAPQKHGVECGGFSIAYTMVHSGASRTQAQRQGDVDATLSLARAMGYQPSAQERSALSAYASGSMTGPQVQTMGEMYYLMARGTLAGSDQSGFSPAQMTRMVTDLTAFGAFQGVDAEIRLHVPPSGSAHFSMRHAGTTGNSMANGAGKASVQTDVNAGLPAGSRMVASISIHGSAAPPTITMTRSSDGQAATISQPRLPAADRTRERYLAVDNAAYGALSQAGIDRT